jgi:hypothetical protein
LLGEPGFDVLEVLLVEGHRVLLALRGPAGRVRAGFR